MVKMFILRGLPGSGKSTYAKAIKEKLMKAGVHENEVVICEADDFFMKKQPDGSLKYEWDGNQVALAYAECQKKAEEGIVEGKYVIIANVNPSASDLQIYLDMANRHNAEFKVFRLMNSFQNLHGVPPEKMEKYAARFYSYEGEIEVYAGDEAML